MSDWFVTCSNRLHACEAIRDVASRDEQRALVGHWLCASCQEERKHRKVTFAPPRRRRQLEIGPAGPSCAAVAAATTGAEPPSGGRPSVLPREIRAYAKGREEGWQAGYAARGHEIAAGGGR